MTLTLSDLIEFRHRELHEPGMVAPQPNSGQFLRDLKEYMDRVKAEAGPEPAAWDQDCEAHAAMDLLQDIFRIRRAKLVRASEHCAPPTPKQMFDFEGCAWFGFLATYKLLDKEIERVCINGEWSGRWGT